MEDNTPGSPDHCHDYLAMIKKQSNAEALSEFDSHLLFGVQSISEVDADKRFVRNDPRVVPRRNRPHIARTKLCFGSVVHSDHYPPREDVDEVANLATVGPIRERRGAINQMLKSLSDYCLLPCEFSKR